VSSVGKHDAGGGCLNLKNSTYEVNEYCSILLLTLVSIHSSKWQTCNLWGLLRTGVSAMSSQTWGVFVRDYWWFVWPKWLVFCLLDVLVPNWKTPAVCCHCFLCVHQESTAKVHSKMRPAHPVLTPHYSENVFWHSLLRSILPGLPCLLRSLADYQWPELHMQPDKVCCDLNMYIIRADEPSCLLTMHTLCLARCKLLQWHQLPYPYILYQQKSAARSYE